MSVRLVAVALVAGCGAAEVADRPPLLPSGFAPSAALEAPVPPGDDVVGRDFLMALETTLQPRWASFLEDLRLRLPPEHDLNRSDLSTQLELTLSPSGVLLNLSVRSSSGQVDFDEAALEVVRDAQPFSRVAVEFLSDDGKGRVYWRFSRDRRQAGAASAQLVRTRWPLAKGVGLLLDQGRVDDALERIATAEDAETTKAAQLDRISRHLIGLALSRGQERAIALAAIARGRVESFAADVAALAATEGASAELREAAVVALGALSTGADKLRSVALGDDPALARLAARALYRRGISEDLIVPARARLGRGGAAREAALAVLAEVPAPSAAKSLRDLSDGADRAVRLAAIEALGMAARSGSKIAAHVLLESVKNRDAAVRAAACRALASSAGPAMRRRARWLPSHRLLRDRDEGARAACIGAVAKLAPAKLRRELGRLAKDTSMPVQVALAAALGGLAGEDSLAALLALASSEVAEVRNAAASALGLRKEPAAAQALDALASDPSPDVRVAAVRAAGTLRGSFASSMDDESAAVRAEALAVGLREGGRDAALAKAVELFRRAQGAERLALGGTWLSTLHAAPAR